MLPDIPPAKHRFLYRIFGLFFLLQPFQGCQEKRLPERDNRRFEPFGLHIS
jgi:hypothetical protein